MKPKKWRQLISSRKRKTWNYERNFTCCTWTRKPVKTLTRQKSFFVQEPSLQFNQHCQFTPKDVLLSYFRRDWCPFSINRFARDKIVNILLWIFSNPTICNKFPRLNLWGMIMLMLTDNKQTLPQSIKVSACLFLIMHKYFTLPIGLIQTMLSVIFSILLKHLCISNTCSLMLEIRRAIQPTENRSAAEMTFYYLHSLD